MVSPLMPQQGTSTKNSQQGFISLKKLFAEEKCTWGQ